MAKTFLQPGFRFHPTDVELVWYYLKRKIMGKPFRFEAISEIELYKFAPWDLRDKSLLQSRDLEWYFFCPRDRKYANGSRTNRATYTGYWKTTGRDRPIVHNSRIVGMKKTLVFHEGKAPRGTRTDWVMYEFRLEDGGLVNDGFSQDAYVLCKIFKKSGPGPKNGEQYGAPFNEEDWEDDIDIEHGVFPGATSSESLDAQAILLEPVPVPQQSVASGVGEPSFMGGLTDGDSFPLEQLEQFLLSSPLRSENATAEMSNPAFLNQDVNEFPGVDTEGIYNELADLSRQFELESADAFPHTMPSENSLNPVTSELAVENYLELNDLDFLSEDDPFEAGMPVEMFTHPFANHLNPHSLNHIYADAVITTSSINDILPMGPYIPDDH